MKEKIIETSLQQFLKHGIRSITMQKLILPLGISTKTVYKYFKDKESLLEECLNVHYKQLIGALNDIRTQSANPVESLCMVYSKAAELDFGTDNLFYHDLNYYYPELQDKVIKQYSIGAADAFTGFISEGVAEGYFFDYLYPPVVLNTLTILYASITRQDVAAKFDIEPAALIRHTVGIYIRGLCTEKGLQIFTTVNYFNA